MREASEYSFQGNQKGPFYGIIAVYPPLIFLNVLDQKIFNAIRYFAEKNSILDFLGIFLAEYLGYFLAVIVLILIFKISGWKKRIQYLSLMGLTAILSRGIITEFIRFFYHKLRPFQLLNFNSIIEPVNQGAFPSGHMALFFALILPVFCINKRLAWYLSGATVLMGIARVFVGVHWPLDIIGGIAVAFISFYIVHKYILKDSVCENCILKK